MLEVAGQYLVAAVVFGVLDVLWLGPVARGIYERHMGHILASPFRVRPAVTFYALYIGGITFFATRPAITDDSWSYALLAGAALGLVAYGTYNLTNRAVLDRFPASIIPIDMAWGVAATGTCAVVTYAICQAVPGLH